MMNYMMGMDGGVATTEHGEFGAKSRRAYSGNIQQSQKSGAEIDTSDSVTYIDALGAGITNNRCWNYRGTSYRNNRI
ncbi:MAG: hypothetical protein LE180_06290 [Endomicrobium sp.]|uniref:hypothetical protein n=1 Tax=Candidatus Endomicrobiellum pyrsonymphae TaxID=1408203 RepID=UPI0035828411|nr:hypothetical protein [Endomicrobium sp.]